MVGLYSVSSFLSEFNNLLYADTSVLASFLWYVKSDDFVFSFYLALSTSSGITRTGRLSSGYDVGVLSLSIPDTRSYLFKSRNIFMVSTGSIVFLSNHLIYLVIVTLFISGLYKLYVYLMWLYTYPTMMELYVFSFIYFLIF